MGLETGTYIGDLVKTNPTATDPKSYGDDHLRLIKSTLLNSFAGFSGVVVATGTEAQGATVNDFTVTLSPAPAAYTTPLVVLFKATHANTGAATVQIGSLGTKPLIAVDGGALKSGDIENGGIVGAYYDGTSFLLISGNDRANRNGDSYSGTHAFGSATVTVATQSAGDNSTKAASTAYADAAVAAEASIRSAADTTLQSNINAKANIDSPTFTGTPAAPTAAAGTSTTQIATTAFVMAQAFSAALPAQTGNAGKFVTTNGTAASWADAVTPTGTQTLTNKTLTDPTLADSTLVRAMLKDSGYTYYNSGTTSALDYTNGSHQRWAPSGTVSLTISNWPPSGNLGELLIEGVNLGAATITWPTINWITSTGATTTTFSSAGVTLQTSGTDFVFLWTRDAGTTIFGKVVR